MTISIKPISIVTFALLVFIPMLSFADPSGQVSSTNSNISPVFSPEDFGPSVCVGCCDENGNQLPSDPVCGCDPVDQCGVCNGDGSSCSCELFDCSGKPFPNPIPYCRLDVNKDKRIDLADDSALRAYTNEHGYGIPVDESNSMFDVTGDDKYITALDLLAISNFLNFPVDGITTVDACGVCGGSGKNECGKCPGDRDFAEPTGPDGICGCPDAINYVGPFNEECKICRSLPNDSCGRCPGSTDYGNSSCKSIDACEGLSIEDLAVRLEGKNTTAKNSISILVV